MTKILETVDQNSVEKPRSRWITTLVRAIIFAMVALVAIHMINHPEPGKVNFPIYDYALFAFSVAAAVGCLIAAISAFIKGLKAH